MVPLEKSCDDESSFAYRSVVKNGRKPVALKVLILIEQMGNSPHVLATKQAPWLILHEVGVLETVHWIDRSSPGTTETVFTRSDPVVALPVIVTDTAVATPFL